MKLTIELVPISSWYSNVRSAVSKEVWDIIRKKCYKLADNVCEICGDTGFNQDTNHRVECHEIFDYDDEKHIQKLVGFIALCPYCHLCKHTGFAQIKGKQNIVAKQLIKVNSMSEEELEEYYISVYKQWRKRSEHSWKVDVSYIQEYINDPKQEVTEPPIF